jgi:spore germination protein YaaH
MAYLTITMNTEGPDPWTTQQAATYIDKATTDQVYIDVIVQEVVRAGYDGVIMDVEDVDHTYPAIQHVFATYNQRVWTAMKTRYSLSRILLANSVFTLGILRTLAQNELGF